MGWEAGQGTPGESVEAAANICVERDGGDAARATRWVRVQGKGLILPSPPAASLSPRSLSAAETEPGVWGAGSRGGVHGGP